MRTTGKIDWGHVIETAFVTTGVGVVFGGGAILAATLKSAAIYATLGGACFTFFGLSLAQAQADGEAGYYDLMLLDLVFSALSLKGANDCFNAAYQTATAANTAKTTTDASTNNKNTAKPDLNWNKTNKKGQTRADHVQRHAEAQPSRDEHGVFFGDPVKTVNDAWNKSGVVVPVADGTGGYIYNIPYPNAGFESGYLNSGAVYDYVTIVIVEENGVPYPATAFPSNGSYTGPKGGK
ncbi:MAG: hypothetical protein J6K77_03795 [Ruminococcus sp.]|nr:hypothetical protein [Ruminococcus sp.]